MRFNDAIDEFIWDRRSQGKINSDLTETAYRAALTHLAEASNWVDPRKVTRTDVKRALRRWANPNTQFARRSFMVAFFDWMLQEGHRKDNPARQTPSPRRRKPQRYRLTRQEVEAFRGAYRTQRERWLGDLGLLAGLRLAELQGLQGQNFQREAGRYVWVSKDIAKGGRERYVPVVPGLELVVADIRATVPMQGYVFPALRWADPGVNSRRLYTDRPTDAKTLWRTVQQIARRAGIPGNVAPHTLRHAFADFIAKSAGVQVAGAMLGHADLKTTQQYLGELGLDELRDAVMLGVNTGAARNPAYRGEGNRTPGLFQSGSRAEYQLEGWVEGTVRHAVAVYEPHFAGDAS